MQQLGVKVDRSGVTCSLVRDGQTIATKLIKPPPLSAIHLHEFTVGKSASDITVACQNEKGETATKVIKSQPASSSTSTVPYEYPNGVQLVVGTPEAKPIITGKQVGCAIVGAIVLGPGAAAGACS